MSCICNNKKLPTVTDCKLITCVKISMSNGEEYTLKTDDLVAIQFVRCDEKIIVRRGRVKEIIIVNKRQLSCGNDNVSRIILDCSEQFTVKIIEIKLNDIIKIGKIDDEFEDYNDRITELQPNFMTENTIPARDHGMITEQDLAVTETAKQTVSKRGFAITK